MMCLIIFEMTKQSERFFKFYLNVYLVSVHEGLSNSLQFSQ